MALATETDPVQATLDALNASAVGEWTNANGKPGRIADNDDYSSHDKSAYEGDDALYVYLAAAEPLTSMDGSGDKFEENADVAVEVWTLDSGRVSRGIGWDVVSVANAYWTDNKTSTQWVTFRPANVHEMGHESTASFGQHNVTLVTLHVMRDVSI